MGPQQEQPVLFAELFLPLKDASILLRVFEYICTRDIDM